MGISQGSKWGEDSGPGRDSWSQARCRPQQRKGRRSRARTKEAGELSLFFLSLCHTFSTAPYLHPPPPHLLPLSIRHLLSLILRILVMYWVRSVAFSHGWPEKFIFLHTCCEFPHTCLRVILTDHIYLIFGCVNECRVSSCHSHCTSKTSSEAISLAGIGNWIARSCSECGALSEIK